MSAAKGKPRIAPFSLRLTDDERTSLERRAGGVPLGAYIKSVVLAEDAPRYRKRRRPPVEDQQLLAEILARLGSNRSAQSLRHLAEAAINGSLVVDEELELELKKAVAEVAWIRATLIEALGLRAERHRNRIR